MLKPYGLPCHLTATLHTPLCNPLRSLAKSHTNPLPCIIENNEGLLDLLGLYIWLPRCSDQLSLVTLRRGVFKFAPDAGMWPC